jgi:SCP-2 sterol transfer family protein
MERSVGTMSAPPSPVPGEEETRRIAEASKAIVDELAGMIGGLQDTSIPIPRSEWTVGETGAHLAYAAIGWSMFARGMFYPHGDGTPQSFADANEIGLMGFPERGGLQLAGHLLDGTRNFLAEVEVRPSDQNCHSPLGELPLGTLTSYFLAHNLMHGCAVSAALNEDFVFRAEHMPHIWPFICYAFQGPLVDPEALEGVSACVKFSLTDAFDFAIVFRNGEAAIVPEAGLPADCHIEVDAVHFFLVLVKLLSVQEAVDLGRLAISGPKPDLGLRFMDFFYVP